MPGEVSHGYCTLDDLREHLGDSGNKLSPGLLARAINAASRAVDDFTGRRFWQDPEPQTVRVTPSLSTPYEMWLPGQFEISSLTGLVVASDDGSGVYGTTWTLDTDYALLPENANAGGSEYGAWWQLQGLGTNRFSVHTIRGVLPIRITARFGWSFIPDQVTEATLLKAAQLFKRKDAPFGVLQFGDIAAVRVARRDIDVIDLLAPFQRDAAMVG